MGAVLGVCGALSCASCAFSTLCSMVTSCCCSTRGGAGVSTRAAKAGYFMIIVISALAALILYTYGDQISWLHDIPQINSLCTNNGQSTESACFGASAVLRISLGLTIFFTVCLLTSFSKTTFAGLWGPKVLIWLICIVGCIFIPSAAIEQYGATARIFALGFLVAQIILLIDFAYHLHETLINKMEATQAALREKFDEIGCCQNLWRWLYIVLVLGLLLASIIGLGIMYHFSANQPVDCGQNIGFLSGTLVTGAVYLVISPLESLSGSRGMLTPSIVFAYCVWLVWSAISAQPNFACNPVPPNSSNTGATVVGMLIAAGSLAYTAFSASRSLPHMFDFTPKAQVSSLPHMFDFTPKSQAAAIAARRASEDAADREPLTAAATGSGAATVPAAGAAKDEHDDEDEERGIRTGQATAYGGSAATAAQAATAAAAVEPFSAFQSALFLFIMVLASLYLAPVVTNWVTDAGDVAASRSSPAAMWVNMASQWITAALFVWTLVAPTLCAGRDFSG